ncbi:MAG: L,D-transpeptidase family protein [Aliishimia sp.]
MKRIDLVLTPIGLRAFGRLYPCTLGKGGLTRNKREGDGATPRGTHKIIGLLYRPDRIARPNAWAHPIGPRDLWSDAADDINYNKMVRTPYASSHETLRRADPLYDLVLLTDWNWPNAVPGRGSAIFIHQWRRPGYATEGCIALSRKNLRELVSRITLKTRLIVP